MDGLDLHVADGETLVLLGKSGCGKTSTMRCVAGLETPTVGVIRIGGRVVLDASKRVDVPPHRRNVGMVFQSYAVWPHRTVVENVELSLVVKRAGRSKARARALEVLELVGLEDYASRPASLLSGGQMQRVALARSIAANPDVLLLDEPLSNLDAALRDELRVELRRIQLESGLTSVYVTHDQQEALALADRIAIMQDGRITQLDVPSAIYERPASASIARFLGAVNVFSVRSVAGERFALDGYPLEVVTPVVAAGGTTLCFRPEAARLEPPAGRGQRCLRTTGRVPSPSPFIRAGRSARECTSTPAPTSRCSRPLRSGWGRAPAPGWCSIRRACTCSRKRSRRECIDVRSRRPRTPAHHRARDRPDSARHPRRRAERPRADRGVH